jgi:hypothetical protein
MAFKTQLKKDYNYSNKLIHNWKKNLVAFLKIKKDKIKYKIWHWLKFSFVGQFIWFLTRKELFPYVLFFVVPPLLVILLVSNLPKEQVKCNCCKNEKSISK